jgi:hypothetical protein
VVTCKSGSLKVSSGDAADTVRSTDSLEGALCSAYKALPATDSPTARLPHCSTPPRCYLLVVRVYLKVDAGAVTPRITSKGSTLCCS